METNDLQEMILEYCGLAEGPAIRVSGGTEQQRRVGLVRSLAGWVTGHERDESPVVYSTLFELLFMFGERGDLDHAYAYYTEHLADTDPVRQGWERFTSRVIRAPRRLRWIEERLTALGQLSTRLAAITGEPLTVVNTNL